MKARILLAFVCCSVSSLWSQTTILSEGFEGAFPGVWNVGYSDPEGSPATWKDVDAAFGGEGAHTGSWKGYCAGIGYAGTSANPTYDVSMSAFMARQIDLTGYSDATLSFWFKIPSIETSFDVCAVYLDNSVLWLMDSPVADWTQSTLSLKTFSGGMHTLAFVFISDDSITYEGWYLDDILVTAANSPPAGTITLSPTNGPPGRAVSVSVTGWPLSLVGQGGLISFDGQPLSQFVVVPSENQNNGAGFGLVCNGTSVNIIVPNAAPGPHVILASTGVGNPGLQATFVVGPDFTHTASAGITATGHFVRGAPFPPAGMQPDEDENPALPPIPEGPYVPRQDSQPLSVAGGGNFAASSLIAGPAGPTDVVKLVRNTGLPATGDPPDPSTASSGKVVISTANTYMAFSTDCGVTFTTLDPTTIFPNDADGGLCCDQVVQYAPQVDRFIWLMQFWDNPRLSCGPNRYRIAVASPADVVSSSGTAWTYWDLTAADLGFTAGYRFMDYPDLVLSAHSFYITANLPCSNGKLIARFGLSDLVAPGAPGLPFQFLAQDDVCYRMAQNCDTRAYWAGLPTSSQIRIFYWDEGSSSIAWNNYTMPTSPIHGGADFQSLTPAGVNWLSFAGPPRNMVATGARVANQVWFAWNAGRDPNTIPVARRIPHPRIDLVEFDATSFALIRHVPIWNASHAFNYPALGVNSEDEVGLSFAWGGGGTFYANHGVGILTGTPFLQNTFTSSHSGYGRYGDYAAVRRHYPEQRLFSASGYGIPARPGVGDGFTYDARYVLFGRSSIPAPICVTPTGFGAAGSYSFRITGEPGEHISIQASADLSRWTNIFETTLQGRTYDFTDTPSPNLNLKFYRVCVPGSQN